MTEASSEATANVWTSMSHGSLIEISRENLREASSIAGKDYPELRKFEAKLPDWLRKLNSERHKLFWIKVANQTRDLVDRIRAHELGGYDTVFVEKPIPENQLTSTFKAWADYASSSDEEQEIDYLYHHTRVTSLPNGIVIPEDMETVWPKGYAVFKEACQTLGFDLITDPLTLGRSGFKGGPSLSSDSAVSMEAFSRLSVDDQRSVNILKSLVMFLKLEPNRVLAQDPKFALSASYALHFLLKTGDPEDEVTLQRSLKHADGGRAIIMDRISQLFQTDRTIVGILMTSIDKIYRSLARRTRANSEFFTTELKNLVVEMCYTSPEGMLEKYYVKERREVTTIVNEIDRNGKPKTVKRKRLVNGYRAPSLFLGEELLTPNEKHRLKVFEHRFSMPKLAKNAKAAFLEQGGDPSKVTTQIEGLVNDAYSLTSLISSVIKQRKKSVRAKALSASQTGKLTQSQWIVAASEIMESVKEIPESTYGEIEEFLRIWGAG